MEDSRRRTAEVYDLAADHFDVAPLSLWARAGQRTVDRLNLVPGKLVLDVCCGTGSTALPAARAVGRFGTVLGVDLSEGLLAQANAKAQAEGLTNIQFRCVDINQLRFPRASCDAVICQFGIFQLPDMIASTRTLWSLVAPGGALAITTWGPRVHEPLRAEFWKAVRARRPELHNENAPTRQVGTPERLRKLFMDAGAEDPEIEVETTVDPLTDVEDFWSTLLGSGNRAVVEALGAEAPLVREQLAEFVAREKVESVETLVQYAVARRPESPA